MSLCRYRQYSKLFVRQWDHWVGVKRNHVFVQAIRKADGQWRLDSKPVTQHPKLPKHPKHPDLINLMTVITLITLALIVLRALRALIALIRWILCSEETQTVPCLRSGYTLTALRITTLRS